MKESIKHTKIKIFVKPIGEKGFIDNIIIKDDIIETIDDADRYLDYGGMRNDIIESYVSYSQYGALETWEIKHLDYLSDYDLIKPPKAIIHKNDTLATLINLTEEKISLLTILETNNI